MEVRLFAGLRERAGTERLRLELPEGARVSDALAHLHEVVGDGPLVTAVNQQYARGEDRLSAGDELALIPPVSGGAPRQPSREAAAPGAASPADGAPAPEQGTGACANARPEHETPACANGLPAQEHGADRGSPRVHVAIIDGPLSLDRLLALVRDPRAGAIVTFLGVTREVDELLYEAYAPMAQREMHRIVRAAADRHGLCAAAAEHRVGTVALSEASVAIAASAPHRQQAFAGAREIIDELKARVPIWKRERGEWVAGTLPQSP